MTFVFEFFNFFSETIYNIVTLHGRGGHVVRPLVYSEGLAVR